MREEAFPLPDHYRRATRVIVRYAIVMAVVSLLAGISFQESTRKLDYEAAPPGMRLEAVLHLGLVHGHVMAAGVLVPLAIAGALFLARRAGGSPVAPRPVRAFLWLYLPFTVLSLGLLLYKGYHVLLAVRGGERDFAAIDAGFLGGSHVLRYAVYAVAHVGMGVGLLILLFALWRSLRKTAPAA